MLLLVALKYDHKQIKITLFIAHTTGSVSLKLKLAVLGQNWEETKVFLHGIDASKAVDKTLLGVSAKIRAAKS